VGQPDECKRINVTPEANKDVDVAARTMVLHPSADGESR
jgi:hypothetical protein